MGISVVRATAQYREREGEQAQRHVNEKIYGTSTNLVETDNWNCKHNKIVLPDTKDQQIL